MRKPSYGARRRDPTKAGARRERLEGRRPDAVDQEGPPPSLAMDRATSVQVEPRSPSLAGPRAYAEHDGQERTATAICFCRHERADVAATSKRIQRRDDPGAAGGLRARLP